MNTRVTSSFIQIDAISGWTINLKLAKFCIYPILSLLSITYTLKGHHRTAIKWKIDHAYKITPLKCILNLNTNSKNEAFLFNKSRENILENYINNYWVEIWCLARSMTDKPAVKWQIIQMNVSLRLKHCLHMPYWEHVINQVQAKILALSCLILCYNRVSVTTNIKNSGLFTRVQQSK